MTIVELLGAAAGGLGAAAATYGAVVARINSVVGAKPKGDDSLRDVVMRIEGKLDAHREATGDELRSLSDRLLNVERRVFTPPARFFPPAAARKPR